MIVTHHLIGDVDSELPMSTCAYFDGLSPNFSMLSVIDLIEKWFFRDEAKPKVILARDKFSQKSKRYSLRTLRSAINMEPNFIDIIDSLQFFPEGRSTIDQTWRPKAYFALSLTAPFSAFFSLNSRLNKSDILNFIYEAVDILMSAAVYGFWFPSIFSPLGYYWGVSVEPAQPNVGGWTIEKSDRISNWRHNTKIGALKGTERHRFSASDGYVRDAYPIMLLSKMHVCQIVGSESLIAMVQERSLGLITSVNEMFLWRIPLDKLNEAQTFLDNNQISLSGRRFSYQS